MPSRRIEASLSPLVRRWAIQDKELLRPLFNEIRSGKEAWSRGSEDDRNALADSLATLNPAGRVIELFGITREPTSNSISFAGEAVFSCCALVAHTAPVIFGSAATIESADPMNGEKISVRISNDMQLLEKSTADIYGSLVDCRPAEILKNPRDRFCRHVKHFACAESAADFCSQDKQRYFVDIKVFHAAAQRLFHRVWNSSFDH